MKLGFVAYESVTALDLFGPLEVLARWPGADVHVLTPGGEPVHTDTGLLLTPTGGLDDLTDPDVVVVPGSSRPLDPLADPRLAAWLQVVAPGARWTTSVCTGASLLAAAGLLRGRRATTHWAFREALGAMGVEVVADRVVVDGEVVTAAGVSSGIDMALQLTALEHGEEAAAVIELAIEYDPAPPSGQGSLRTARPATVAAARQALLAAAA